MNFHLERRKLFFDDKKKYLISVIDLIEERDEMFSKAIDELLGVLNITRHKFDDSWLYLCEKGSYQEIQFLEVRIRYKMK